jgi:hypothetical protein
MKGRGGVVCAAFSVDDVDDDFLEFAWLNLKPKDRSLILSKSPKTFWLFGAGASHHYDLNAFRVPVPLAKGFFEAFDRLPTSQGFHAHVGPLISFLEHYRGVSPGEVPGWTENIEDFMTSVEGRLDELKESTRGRRFTEGEFGDVISYAQVFSNMTFIFANVLNEAQNGPSLSLYRAMLAVCGPNDSFATFNWDTLLDRALMDTGGWSPNTGYGLKFRAVLDGSWRDTMEGDPSFPTEWKLLKLHGSTNWLVPYMGVHFQSLEYTSIIPDNDEVFLYWHSSLPYATHKNRWAGGYVPTTYCYYPPNIPGEFFSREQLSPEPDRVFVRGTIRFLSAFEEGDSKGVPSSPILITPVRQKRYDTYASTIQGLWDQLVRILEQASRIVVVGYSFPPTDTRALDLFRGLLGARGGDIVVEIVSPGVADIAKRIGDDYLGRAKEVKLHNMKFEEYVDLLSQSMPSLMRQGAAEHAEVRDWLERIYVSSRRRAGGYSPV